MATPVCMKRMRREREQLEKSPNGEYCVQFKDEDLLNFTAYISGPEDSLYRHKFIKLKFHIPTNYPLVPPKVTFVQYSSGRIHPNLYVEGKVCLSILGTWPGEPWATAMNVESILITIRSLLDNKPYMHEPHQRDNPAFNNYVQYATWQCLLLDHLAYEQEPRLKAFMQQYIRDNGSQMVADLQEQQRHHVAARNFVSAYSRQSVIVNYPSLLQALQSHILKIKSSEHADNNENDKTLQKQADQGTSLGANTLDQPSTLQESQRKRKSGMSDCGGKGPHTISDEGANKKRKAVVIDLT